MFKPGKGCLGHMKLDGPRTDDEPENKNGYAKYDNKSYDDFYKEAEEAAATTAAVPTSAKVAFRGRGRD